MSNRMQSVPDSFGTTLAELGIDVRNQNVLEVGAGACPKALWLAKLGAKQVVAIDPTYQNGDCEERKQRLVEGHDDPNILLLPHTIENHVRRGNQYPIVTAFQAYPHEWESYIDGVSKATTDNGVALIMMDKFVFDQMPRNIFERYFKDVQMQRCGGGDLTSLDESDEFFLIDCNRYAFVCHGPKRNIEQDRSGQRCRW